MLDFPSIAHLEPTMNGYELIAAAPRKGGGFVIIARRQVPRVEYVVAAVHHNSPDNWSWGHYTLDFDAAMNNFKERCI